MARARRGKAPATPAPGQRPLRALSPLQLQQQLAQALQAHDGPAGAHAIHELWMRRAATPAQIDALLARLWEHCAASVPDWLPMRHVPWLEFAYDAAAQFHAAKSGRSHIYLALLDYRDRRTEPWGVYVGMTSHAPALRFDQHKQGIRASNAVLKRGLELLMGPVMHLQYIARAEAVRIEADLADALRALGITVEGGH